MNVGEYNTLDMVKDDVFIFCTIIFGMQEKGHNVLFQPMRNLDFGH
jgi:hypothetical protein